MPNIRDLSRKPELFTPGHRACAGCGFPILVRAVLRAAEEPVVVSSATGCLEVTSTLFPYSAWRVPFIHSAFENSAATMSGVEAAYRALRRQGKIGRELRFIAFGGDGGTYDIGLQSLSGAMERGHRLLYVCYDNGAYANTGVQRSSATPRGANTTTSPAGRKVPGKTVRRKDLTAMMAAQGVPYVAQASIAHWNDLTVKVQKALAVDGPSFINALAPCRLSWGIDPDNTVDLVRLAVETCAWPLYEVEEGRWRLNYLPREKKPYADWLKVQTRFKHLFRQGGESLLSELQAEVDKDWEAILARCGGNVGASTTAKAGEERVFHTAPGG
ncbi:MAG: thiamine pyrophosphate-dependent enzyme [Patescibacteria group bacterium]